MKTTIDPRARFGSRFLSIEKPARYAGGEAHISIKPEAHLTIALCFPDLYEIGMSNQAIKILYRALNALNGVRCERVFAPAPDFEKLLMETDTPLYTLESGIPLHETDILAFSMGYELSLTNAFTVMNSGRIGITNLSRTDGPLVIAGGPAITNPRPVSDYFDAVWIGEAEAGFFALIANLAEMKKTGASRQEIKTGLLAHDAMWHAGKKARRAIFADFADTVYDTSYPFPSVKPVQDHGTVEIMRGCPNGCRFCHAGYFYRPMRPKSIQRIKDEVKCLVEKSGCREITLSSLSSGDFPGIGNLLDSLNETWKSRHVSFQLPSLKVSSFSLPILESLSETRKSGLTFAVETPMDAWQRIINKEAYFDKIIEILAEAKNRGWKLAKFYFMIGLPVPVSVNDEAKAIIEFLKRISAVARMQLNVNVGVFVPKPHTPFQWCKQAGEKEAFQALGLIRETLKPFRIKVSTHDPFVSMLEGLYSRGDERVGALAYNAWMAGARFDAWQEYFNPGIWRSLLETHPYNGLVEGFLSYKDPGCSLPWDEISMGLSGTYLKREYERSIAMEMTGACAENCNTPCGICTDSVSIGSFETQESSTSGITLSPQSGKREADTIRHRFVFFYSKNGKAAYLSHLNVMEAFSRALASSLDDIAYSEGFNPMIKLEFASPLSLGIDSREEVAAVTISSLPCIPLNDAIKGINANLQEGLSVSRGTIIEWPLVRRAVSLASLFSASRWEIGFVDMACRDAFIQTARTSAKYLSVAEVSSSETAVDVEIENIQKKESQPQTVIRETVSGSGIDSEWHIERTQLLARDKAGTHTDYITAMESFCKLPDSQT